MIRIVLREPRTQHDLRDYVDEASLVRLWPSLDLSDRIRRAWEERFQELTKEPRG